MRALFRGSVLAVLMTVACDGGGAEVDAPPVDAFTYFRVCSAENPCPGGFECLDFGGTTGERCTKRCDPVLACETPPGGALCDCGTEELASGEIVELCKCVER